MKKFLKGKRTFTIRFLSVILALCWSVVGLADDDPVKQVIVIPNPEPSPLIGVPAQFGFSVAGFMTAEELVIIASAPFDLVEGISAGAVHLIDGTTGELIITIPNPAPASNDQFGWSVAVDQNGNILVGARCDNDPDGPGPVSEVVNAGAAFVFNSLGDLIHEIPNPFPEPGDLFGERVAFDQNGNIIVGAMRDDDPDGPGPIPKIKDPGAVFVFDGATGSLVHTIPSVSYKPWDWFGAIFAAWENKIFIADPYYPGPPDYYGGAVRVFDAATGDLLDTWPNPYPPEDGSWDTYGIGLAVDESRSEIIIGSFSDNDPDGPGPIPEITNAGAVFVHNYPTGEIIHTICNPFPDIGDFFGRAVAAAGGKYVISAWNDDDPDGPGPINSVTNAGSVFVFDAETAEPLHTIWNPFPGVGDLFGSAITVVDNNIIIGASSDDDPDGAGPISPVANTGSVFVLDLETGERRLTIESPGGLVPATQDRFGTAVSLSPSRIIAGAPQDALDPDGPGGMEPLVGAGSIYVFDKGGKLRTIIWNPFPAVGDNFGASVAVDDHENIIIGAPSDDDPDGPGPLPEVFNAGAIFIYNKDGILLRTIRDPFPNQGDNFGASVAIDKYGNIIVGAPSDDDPDGPGPAPEVPNAGTVFVFDVETAELLHTIPNPAPASPDNFGSSVAVDKHGNIVVGAVNDGDPDGPEGPIPPAVESGAAFVFDINSGLLLHTLYDPAREPIDQFGRSVAVDENGKAIVGAMNSPGGGGGGAVFIFDLTTGAHLNTITNPAPLTGDLFGRSVAVTGGKYVIGAAGDDDPDGSGPLPEIVNAGAVFIFDAETGDLVRTITDPFPGIHDNFGLSIAAKGGQYIIGAPFDDDPDGPGPIPEALDAGAVFFFDEDDDVKKSIFAGEIQIESGGTLQSSTPDEEELVINVENYPNPFSIETEIRFQLSQDSNVSLKVYNIHGKEIQILTNTTYNAGMHSIPWDGRDMSGNEVSGGVYFYRIQIDDVVRVNRMLLIR